MVTLKQLVEKQKCSDITDIQIIEKFFVLNDMEEGMDLIQKIVKSKIEKMEYKNRLAKEWASYLPSKYLYENYDLDTADMLHTLEINYLVNGGELSDNFLKWTRKNVPQIVKPKVYVRALIEWLESKDIKFKDK